MTATIGDRRPWSDEEPDEPAGVLHLALQPLSRHRDESCRVYWGSHGCGYRRGHAGPHECVHDPYLCCECPDHDAYREEQGCVARPPYYGPDTNFYGEDAEALGLPLHPESSSQ